MTVPSDIHDELDGPARRAIEWIDARLDAIEAAATQQVDTTDIMNTISELQGRLDVAEYRKQVYDDQFLMVVKLMNKINTQTDQAAQRQVISDISAALDTI